MVKNGEKKGKQLAIVPDSEAPTSRPVGGYIGRELYPDEQIILAKVRHQKARRYLETFALVGKSHRAARIAQVATSSVYTWRDNDPAFRELYDALNVERVAGWNDSVEGMNADGWTELMYDKNNQLVGRRVKQEPAAMKAFMASIDPNWRNDTEGGTVINIVIQDVRE